MVTEKKKIQILEKLLDKKNQEILSLKQELEKRDIELENYHKLDYEINEFRDIIAQSHQLNLEYRNMIKEYVQDKNKLMRKIKKVKRM